MRDAYGETQFERDLIKSSDILSLILDNSVDEAGRTFSSRLYSALCNNSWIKLIEGESVTFSASWRYAGGFISNIRNETINFDEHYMTYYMNGCEGCVFPDVEAMLNSIGWYLKVD